MLLPWHPHLKSGEFEMSINSYVGKLVFDNNISSDLEDQVKTLNEVTDLHHARMDMMIATITRLTDRVQFLERLVTDDGK